MGTEGNCMEKLDVRYVGDDVVAHIVTKSLLPPIHSLANLSDEEVETLGHCLFVCKQWHSCFREVFYKVECAARCRCSIRGCEMCYPYDENIDYGALFRTGSSMDKEGNRVDHYGIGSGAA